MKKFFEEFKKFINKGNVIDLAVAVIIGAAFGKIVTSLVNDIITPLTALIIGTTDLNELKWVIIAAEGDAGEIAIYYGRFIKNIFDFLIVAFSMFLVIKFYNHAKVNFHKQITEGELIKRVGAATKIDRLTNRKESGADAQNDAEASSMDASSDSADDGEAPVERNDNKTE
ncbi:MAG: large conductance mechanosensitive channel protein MscL [Clostridiales bacterium]|jgi:large conductance mechanosensitive channel|nr:large conductance mechanosensitive channel protein MscL [Clostridiales bacterium]